MPRTSATRRASRASSSVQQPREPACAWRGCAPARGGRRDVVPGLDRTRRGDRGVDAAGQRGDDPHRAGLRPRRARCDDGPSSAAMRRATSASVRGPAEGEPQRAARRDRIGTPIASSTWLGCGTPAEQADPVEHSTPAASSSSSSESPSQPGNDRCALPGSRLHEPGRRCGWRRRPSRAPAPRGRRAARRRAAVRSSRSASDAVSGRGQAGDRRRVEGAGADVALLAAAVQRAGRERAPRRSTSAPTPTGAAELVAGEREGVTPMPAKSTGSVPDGLHGVGVERHAVLARQSAATSATGWTVPTSLLAHITRDERDLVGVLVELGARARRGRPARGRRPAATTRRRPRARRATRPGRARRGARRRVAMTRVRRGSAARRAQ